MDIKNKNELKRRIDLFLHDFTPEEYKINEEFCKETMRTQQISLRALRLARRLNLLRDICIRERRLY